MCPFTKSRFRNRSFTSFSLRSGLNWSQFLGLGDNYHDVFSPSPVQHTEKLLQAMRVNLHLENLAWDIKQAYTWAPLPKEERVAVVYPDGFKRSNGENRELFMVLERNLYGMPSASRG